jgi:hypothetical protein
MRNQDGADELPRHSDKTLRPDQDKARRLGVDLPGNVATHGSMNAQGKLRKKVTRKRHNNIALAMPKPNNGLSKVEEVIRQIRGRGSVKMTTDQIMRLTRGKARVK